MEVLEVCTGNLCREQRKYSSSGKEGTEHDGNERRQSASCIVGRITEEKLRTDLAMRTDDRK